MEITVNRLIFLLTVKIEQTRRYLISFDSDRKHQIEQLNKCNIKQHINNSNINEQKLPHILFENIRIHN